MDAERGRRQFRLHLRDDAIDVVRHRAAIGVAQHQPARAGVVRGADAGERVVRIGLVAVEEMFGVEQRLALLRDHGGDRLGDAVDILAARNLERDIDMEVPGLADEAGRVRLGVEDRRQARVVGGAAAGALGHAEGGEARALERRAFGEERRVGRVGAGPAALDVIDAERVERERDLALVLDGEVDALRLRPVAQRRVEEVRRSLVMVNSRDAIALVGSASSAGRDAVVRVRRRALPSRSSGASSRACEQVRRSARLRTGCRAQTVAKRIAVAAPRAGACAVAAVRPAEASATKLFVAFFVFRDPLPRAAFSARATVPPR